MGYCGGESYGLGAGVRSPGDEVDVGGLVYGLGEVSLTEGNIHILDGAPVVPINSSGQVQKDRSQVLGGLRYTPQDPGNEQL